MPLYTEMSSFQGVGVYRGVLISEGWSRGSSTVYRGVLISGCWNRGAVYIGVLISGCWNRGAVYIGVLISGCWNRGVPLYTEVSSFQGFRIEEFHCI